jgi:hypothetical protein
MELASIIKEINRKQYHQAHTTPFGSGLLAQQLGHRGNTAAALALLNGTLPSVAPSLLPETQRILQTLARNHPTIPDSSVITAQDFQDSYKLAKEATSSSPSGRHIGHYKAVVADPVLNDGIESQTSCWKKQQVIQDAIDYELSRSLKVT